ncbi:MAG: hypothetical protein ACOZAQ_00830 [Pseudomonadota bacterium]
MKYGVSDAEVSALLSRHGLLSFSPYALDAALIKDMVQLLCNRPVMAGIDATIEHRVMPRLRTDQWSLLLASVALATSLLALFASLA